MRFHHDVAGRTHHRVHFEQAVPLERDQRRVALAHCQLLGARGPGVLVAGVSPDSPAAKVGFKAGDVIVEFAGKAIDPMRGFPE